ncbi:NfeD family protein [Rhodobacter lacus]|uniref:NfeD family protein n=1 Tax=Rhodobacter lacus TaxID=1641972 RepID=A0ABW5ADM3_9RHOB
MSWQDPWIWIVAGVVLGGLEMVLPGFILLGFAAGSVLVGVLLWLGLLANSLPLTVLVLAIAAVLVWYALRRILGVRAGQTRIWDRDINEN